MNNRIKNAARNAYFGVFLRIYQIAVPFVLRTAIIYFLGIDYLGLNELFTSLLQVLNMAELGVSAAMVFSMYKPVAETDNVTLNALLRLYKIYYMIIGAVIGCVGIILIPFVPRLISGSVPKDINLYILYIINLMATVLSYWLFSYKISVFQAHQRVDIVSKITIISNTIQYLLQFLVLWLFHNYYLFIIMALVLQVINNLAIAICADRFFPELKPEGKLQINEVKTINIRIRDLFTAKLGTVFGTSVDSIVISYFLGLQVLAVYQNYYYVVHAISSIVIIVYSSCIAGIGNSLVTENEEKNYYDFRKMAFISVWICVVCISCFACVYQPFMRLWVGEKYMLPYQMVVLMCIYFYVYVIHMLSCVYKDASGIWEKDKWRPLIAGIFNLALNISMVKIWGVYAILGSTIVSYVLVAMPWVINNLFKIVFKKNPQQYVKEILKGAVLSFISASTCVYVCSLVKSPSILGLVIRIVIAFVISNLLLIISRRQNEMYNDSIDVIDSITGRRMTRLLCLIKVRRRME